MTSAATRPDEQRERGFTLHRHLDAPPAAVFRAWTDPDHLGWFAGSTASRAQRPEVDLRPGGQWRQLMVEGDGPDARTYVTGGLYHEVDAPHRLVFSFGAVGGWPDLDPEHPGTVPLVVLTLAAADGGTDLALACDLPDAVSAQQVREWFAAGIAAGWATTLGRLVRELSAARFDGAPGDADAGPTPDAAPAGTPGAAPAGTPGAAPAGHRS